MYLVLTKVSFPGNQRTLLISVIFITSNILNVMKIDFHFQNYHVLLFHIFYVKTLQIKIHKREWERESDIRIRKKFPGILRQLSMVSCPFQPFMGHSDDGENLLLINGFLFLTPDPAWSNLEQIKIKINISVLSTWKDRDVYSPEEVLMTVISANHPAFLASREAAAPSDDLP